MSGALFGPSAAGLGLLAGGAAWAGVRGSKRSRGSAALLVAALLVLAALLGPALDERAHHDLTAHMVQHLGLILVVAPLLAAVAPIRLLLATLPRDRARRAAAQLRRPLVRRLTHPAAGAVAFALTVGVVHLPAVYDAALRSTWLHAVEHAALFWSAVWLWVPVLGREALPRRVGGLARAAAVIAATIAMAVVGAAIVTSDQAWFSTYRQALGAQGALADQQRAGGVMWVGGMVLMLPLLLASTWSALADEERRAQARERRLLREVADGA